MKLLTIFLVILVAQHTLATVVGHSDPSACQQVIKYMLINACGATKREFHSSPMNKVMLQMDEAEIEKRYNDMVEANMIKGVNKNYIEKNEWDWDPAEDLNDLFYNEIHLKPYYQRLRRSVIGIRAPMRKYAESLEHERRGSFHFIGRLPPERDDRDDWSPPPRELKTKCCGSAVCTMDDFRGFCE